MVIRSRSRLINASKKIISLFPIWFYLFSVIFCVNRYCFRPTGNYILDGWLNDFLCLPILLELVQYSMRIIVRKNYTLSAFQTIVSILYCSALFEYILPKYSTDYHADIIDVFCYIIGGFIWLTILNKNQREL